jgi:hypothetical protein
MKSSSPASATGGKLIMSLLAPHLDELPDAVVAIAVSVLPAEEGHPFASQLPPTDTVVEQRYAKASPAPLESGVTEGFAAFVA